MTGTKNWITSARRIGISLATLTLSAAATVGVSGDPAYARPACHPEIFTYSGGGWCEYQEGWDYFGGVQCTDGRWYYGPPRDSGNRIGSYGQCPSGSYANRVLVTAY